MLISAALLSVGLSGCALTPYATSDYDDYPRSHHEVYYRPAPPVRYVVITPPPRHMAYERVTPRHDRDGHRWDRDGEWSDHHATRRD
jgi:hypothetical protein